MNNNITLKEFLSSPIKSVLDMYLFDFITFLFALGIIITAISLLFLIIKAF